MAEYCRQSFPCTAAAAQAIETVLAAQINCPVTSSLGRLFDGVAAILGIRTKVNFEGQAAMELEAAADSTNKSLLPYSILNQAATLQLISFRLSESLSAKTARSQPPCPCRRLSQYDHTVLCRYGMQAPGSNRPLPHSSKRGMLSEPAAA